jgi:hypothetical protein
MRVLATDTAVRLVRLDSRGATLASHDLVDPQAPTDPFLSDPFHVRDSHSMVPRNTRDAARLGAAGEDAVLVLRTGRNAVVAYRFAFGTSTGFRQTWRTLVEPGIYIGNLGLTGGTIDPFGGLDVQWRLTMDVDAQGRVAVAVGTLRTELAEGHAAHFKEPYHDNLYGVALVTQLDPDGRRVGTAAVSHQRRWELHTARWVGDAVAVGGRVYSENRSDGSGWDAWINLVHPRDGGIKPAVPLDVEQGDAILDIAAAADGQIVVAGSTGYTQNPAGASISEQAAPLLAVLDAQGKLVRRIPFTAGPRHNQLRSITGYKTGWVAGGLENGPGTHSADANPGLLFADGYVRSVNLAPQ